jgi:hypothetical protein
MAKVKNGVFGQISGKLGQTVFYQREGIQIAQQDRSTPPPKRFLPTEQKIQSQRGIKDRMLAQMISPERLVWLNTFGSYDNMQRLAFWATARILEVSNPPTSNPKFLGKEKTFVTRYVRSQNNSTRFLGYQWLDRDLTEIAKGQVLFWTFNYNPAPVLTSAFLYRYSPTFPFFGFVSTPEQFATITQVRCVAIQLTTGNYQVFDPAGKF